MESGEMFVFARHVCFRRTKTALFDPAESAKPTKFAVPAAAVVDAAPNPSVYPFGAYSSPSTASATRGCFRSSPSAIRDRDDQRGAGRGD